MLGVYVFFQPLMIAVVQGTVSWCSPGSNCDIEPKMISIDRQWSARLLFNTLISISYWARADTR